MISLKIEIESFAIFMYIAFVII